MRSDWNFDTIKTTPALGTFRGTINDLSSLPSGMVAEEEESFDDLVGHDSIDTGAATKGSDPILANGLGMNPEASHSTVIIKPPCPQETKFPEETPGG
jgi:serine/threonine-protein kinase 24/25/MST4